MLLRRAGEIARDAGEVDLMFEAVDAITTAGFRYPALPGKGTLAETACGPKLRKRRFPGFRPSPRRA